MTSVPSTAAVGALVERQIVERTGPGGLRFLLSQGTEQLAGQKRIPLAVSASLSAAEAQQVLDRLPPLQTEGEDIQDFAFPKRSLPPPRTGETVEEPFPPPFSALTPEPPAGGPLEVLRYQPEGEISQAPHLSITFDQPMEALTAHADLAARGLPVQLAPKPPGAWRWVGTKTLLFEPEFRSPMATRYTATVQEGTASAIGGNLASTVTWSFNTT